MSSLCFISSTSIGVGSLSFINSFLRWASAMPPFRSQHVIDTPVLTNDIGHIIPDTDNAAISTNHHGNPIISARSTLVPRGTSSSTTAGIVLGSIGGFLVLLALIYVCYFRQHSTMYIMSVSSTSSKNSRRRRKPVLFGLPRPKDVIVVEIVRSNSHRDGGGAAAEPAAAAAAPAAE